MLFARSTGRRGFWEAFHAGEEPGLFCADRRGLATRRATSRFPRVMRVSCHKPPLSVLPMARCAVRVSVKAERPAGEPQLSAANVHDARTSFVRPCRRAASFLRMPLSRHLPSLVGAGAQILV